MLDQPMKKGQAVSESVGYLIIFGLVLTGISLITLYGYPLLMQQESSANLRNMEQSMIVLQNDIKALTYKLANYKETTLRVSGGSLSFFTNASTPQRFRINSSDGTFDLGYFFPGELRYYSPTDNTVITLENGAVIKKQLTIPGAVMLAEPRWYIDTDPLGKRTFVINYISLGNVTARPGIKDMSRTGVSTVRMSHYQTILRTGGEWDPPTSIYIQYLPDNTATIMPDGYATAWKSYLTDSSNLAMTELPSPPNPPYYYRLDNIKSVIVKEYDIMVETL